MKDFSNMNRNFDKIQFEALRKLVDGKFNLVHDELSDCFYNKKPFRNYGVLSKDQFDKLHGLIFLKREVEFHEENLKLPLKDRIPEEKYNEKRNEKGVLIEKNNEKALLKIQELKSEGINLIISGV